MCGRYAVTSAPEAIRAMFGYPEQPNFPPRYNIAPTQPIAIVRLADGKRQFALVRWGLLPPWVKDPKNFSLLINARGESLKDKPAFSAAATRPQAVNAAPPGAPCRQSGRETAAVPRTGRRLLRVEDKQGRQAALLRVCEIRRTDCVC